MRQNFLITIIYIVLIFFSYIDVSQAETYVSGNVSGTWTTEKSPYIIFDNVVVREGTSLTIEPGVNVKLKPDTQYQAGAQFIVHGTLIAVGTLQDSIKFTKINENGYWGSLLFQDANNDSRIQYCSISYGSGTRVGSYSSDAAVYCYNSAPTIKNSLFIKNIYGISIREGSGSSYTNIIKNHFAYNKKSGISNDSYNTLIKHNVFHHNKTGISCTSKAIIENNTIVKNQIGIWTSGHSKPIIKNCIVWDNLTNISDNNIDWSGEVDINFSDIQGGWAGYGNIDMNPLFNEDTLLFFIDTLLFTEDTIHFVVDTLYNYYLSPSSSCIDNGDPISDYSLEPTPNGNIINIGAYGNTHDAETSSENEPEILITSQIIDFGLLPTNEKDSLLVTIRNIGTATLNINNIINRNSVFEFSFKQTEIEPKKSTDLCIYFQSNHEGEFLDTLWIENNDFSEGKSFIYLHGKTSSAMFGEISGILTKQYSPYIISDDLIILKNETLLLEPGVKLELMTDASLLVYGTLNCVGNELDSIIFTTHIDHEYWGGIYFGPESDSSKMKYTVVEYGRAFGKSIDHFSGTNVHLIACNNSGPVFSNNTIKPIDVGGITIWDANTNITNNNIFGGAYAGIVTFNSNSFISKNFIQGNKHHGISITNGGRPRIFNNILIENKNGIYCSDTYAQIINNTIIDNSKSGITCFGSIKLPIIKNNILWGNTNVFYLYGGAESVEIDITYNDIQGGWEGEGNVNINPDFINAEENNYCLSDSSKCINAGDPDSQYYDEDGSRNDIGATGGPNGYYLNPLDIYETNRKNILPDDFSLFQNYPNPFNPTTNISYNIPQDCNVLLSIYDITGRKINTIINQHQTAGNYTIKFSATNLPSGIYFFRLATESFEQTKKMILLH